VSPLWLASMVAPFMTLFSRITGKRPLFTSESMQILKCHQKIESTKARDELGFSPRPVRDSVVDTLTWFAGNGYFKKGGLLSGESRTDD
jgi:dihydroflavonol-4-reductase